jgi:predicted outer membrane repeat protein
LTEKKLKTSFKAQPQKRIYFALKLHKLQCCSGSKLIGALYAMGQVTVQSCTFTGDYAKNGQGGGIFVSVKSSIFIAKI